MSKNDILESQADELFNNLAGWEQSVINRIAKRISSLEKMSLGDVKAINNVAVVKQDMEIIIRELAEQTGLNISQIQQMYADVISSQHLENNELYDYRGKTFVPFAENKELQSLVSAYAKTTAGNMINLSKSTANHLGFLDKDGNFKAIDKFYSEALDKAILQVSTGSQNFHTALRDTIETMGGSGIRVNYGSGITRRLDTAVRQSILWGAKQASIEYNDMIGEELGCDGYEIDWHSFPRPSHAFMQGKQYCIGKSITINGTKFTSFEEPDPKSEEGKSAQSALNDYGCLHYKTPIICGISEPRYSPEELARLNKQNEQVFNIDGNEMTGYECTQAMRRLESAAREQKTIREGAKVAGEHSLVNKSTDKIKAFQKKYNEISEITGIPKQPKRMGIVKIEPISFVVEKGISGKNKFKTDVNKVNLTYIESKEFKDKFKKLPYNDEVRETVYKQSKALLTHRNGTNFEDLCLVDCESGSLKCKSYNILTENEVFYSKKAQKTISDNKNKLISIHNHGTNNPPTGSDIVSASGKKYNMGIVVCHDGSLYTYTPANKVFTRRYFDKTVDKYIKLGYNEKEAIKKVLNEVSKNYEFEWDEL